MKTFRNPLFYLVILLAGAVVFSVVRAAFTEPSNSFPGSAPAAPLDTSSLFQAKNGNLQVGALGIGKPPAGYPLDVSGALRVSGFGEFGDTANTYRLHNYNDYSSFWIEDTNDTQPELVLAGKFDWDRTVSFQYAPGTTGAAAGILTIGQLRKNNNNWTHGITSFYTNGVERMRIDATGNIGIGTDNPTSGNLQLANNYSIFATMADNDYWKIYSEGGSNAGKLVIETGDDKSEPIVFRQRQTWDPGSGYRDAMIIDASGNVGIGTAKPTAKLEVIGTASSTEVCISGVCQTSWPAGGTASQWTTTSTGIYYNGGNVGIGTAFPIPARTLTVNGSSYFKGDSIFRGYVSIEGSFNPDEPGAQLFLRTSDANSQRVPAIWFGNNGSDKASIFLNSDNSLVIAVPGGSFAFKDGVFRLNQEFVIGGTPIPSCNSTNGGMLIYVQKGAYGGGINASSWDELYICRRTSGGTWEWKKLT